MSSGFQVGDYVLYLRGPGQMHEQVYRLMAPTVDCGSYWRAEPIGKNANSAVGATYIPVSERCAVKLTDEQVACILS